MILVPLTVKQIHSMQSLQRHAPQMKEIQKKYKGDKQKQNEELMKFYRENQINPAASCLPMLAAVPGLHRAVLRAAQLLARSRRRTSGQPLLAPLHPVDRATHDVALGRLRAARRLRRVQMASTLYMSATADKTQRTIFMLMPLVFVFVIAHFPAGLVLYWVTTNLWTVGQGLITRRLVPKTPAPALEKKSSRTPPKDDGVERQRREAEPRRAEAARRRVAAAAAEGAQEEEGRPAVSASELTVEATGETVGEAKWAALRELELRHPALDKSAVRFEVVTEGERGLLGVGYEPARVIAHLPADAAEAVSFDESEQAADARGS